MIRKHLSFTIALLVLLTSSAAASSSVGTPEPSGRSVVDAPACGGKGFTQLFLDTTRYGCIHTARDVFNPYAASQAMARGIKPATAKVPCYGDGTTGPRIQMIYGYHEGIPNRSATVIKQIRNEMAPRMQAVISNQSSGKDVGLRFAMTPGCGAIDVKVIKFPRAVQYGPGRNPADPGPQLAAATNYLEANGHNRDDRKYLIMWDGWNEGACGIGWLAAGNEITSLPGSPISDGVPTLGARTDPATVIPPIATKVSMVFNHAGGRHGMTCFNTQGMSTVTPQLHELFHNLGAVQLDAPHANTGHCDDAPSVMCPGFGPGYGLGVWNKACARVLVETLDCGMDDYWNPSPTFDNYLMTHLNLANSQFFGVQSQDLLVAAPL